MESQEIFGFRLRMAMARAKKSKEQLSKEANASLEKIEELMSGKSIPNSILLCDIADALSVSFEYFLKKFPQFGSDFS